jgi:anti-sigma factor RsiW
MAERCDGVEPLLSAHLDGEVRSAERAALETHLAGCPSCAAELDQLRVVRSLVRSLPVRRLPEGVGPLPAAAAAPEHRGLLRAGVAFAAALGLLGGAAFSLGGQPAPDTRLVTVPVDVYVADHFVHTAHRAFTVPVTLDAGR